MGAVSKLLIIGLLGLIPVPTLAQSFADPTRPMDFSAGASAGAGSSARVDYGPVLQSTFVSPQRKLAIISGKSVRIGDKFEGAVVTEITPYEVRLSRGGKETSLRLSPKLAKEKGRVE